MSDMNACGSGMMRHIAASDVAEISRVMSDWISLRRVVSGILAASINQSSKLRQALYPPNLNNPVRQG